MVTNTKPKEKELKVVYLNDTYCLNRSNAKNNEIPIEDASEQMLKTAQYVFMVENKIVFSYFLNDFREAYAIPNKFMFGYAIDFTSKTLIRPLQIGDQTGDAVGPNTDENVPEQLKTYLMLMGFNHVRK